MTSPIRDPLLAAAKIIIGFFIVIAGIVIAAIIIGIPAMLLNQGVILAQMVKDGAKVGPEVFGALSLLMVSLAGFLALGIWFLLLLRRIVDTVGRGDPFVPENGDRLARMGWITVGTQVLMIPFGAMALWLADIFKGSENIQINGSFTISGGAIVLTLVLFILARVFRHGATMRQDLEGTV